MNQDYKPRLSVNISQEQFNRVSRLIPWGVKHRFIQAILDDILDVLEEHGDIAIAAIINKNIGIIDIIKAAQKRDK